MSIRQMLHRTRRHYISLKMSSSDSVSDSIVLSSLVFVSDLLLCNRPAPFLASKEISDEFCAKIMAFSTRKSESSLRGVKVAAPK